ncbi:hypothetical protein NQ314_017077 [Rhamnusium bicolor]|uniref:Uncharacterized protein n=1 Tax=Rhamnusium bicolor TaxID=1586634 RepID=A0AAV8WVF1_9CUCU|nr:hypothetical protein NQ314_017077 [Rhamnusium bicolor]
MNQQKKRLRVMPVLGFFQTAGIKCPVIVVKKEPEQQDKVEEQEVEEAEKSGCFSCLKKKEKIDEPVRINVEDETGKKLKLWDKLKCCNKHKVRDTSCFPTGKRKDSWVERRDSILSDPSQPPPSYLSERKQCVRIGNVTSTEKNVTYGAPQRTVLDPLPFIIYVSDLFKIDTLGDIISFDNRPKIDLSLVEHASHMKGAIPVLPICLAWFCLVMNCIAPGTGTVFSGFFCLCIGKPRFSQKDGPKQRIGSFIINLIIGFGQFFTVLFCLVGWGWSIWWGVIMLRIASKYDIL